MAPISVEKGTDLLKTALGTSFESRYPNREMIQ